MCVMTDKLKVFKKYIFMVFSHANKPFIHTHQCCIEKATFYRFLETHLYITSREFFISNAFKIETISTV